MEIKERLWITAWAALMGFSLLMLHNWVDTLNKPGEFFGIIWPFYVTSLSLPMTFQMMSCYRTEKLLWLMAAGFSLVMAGSSAYIAQYTWVEDLPDNYSYRLLLIPYIIFTCWIILLSLAEHKLMRQTWCDDYSLLFASAWRNALKLVSAAVFVGLFWGLLFLWAGLFKVLKINFFYDLFTGRNFVYPVTAIAYGIGLSLYSAKEEVLAGLYRTCLNVLGWLLPLVIFIMLLFLVALPFQGLALLWKTGYATALIITLLGCLVFLFNAAWQDAESTLKFPKWLVNLISLGLVAMPIYTFICTYSLGLRISQYGWSIDRIWASLAVFMLSIYSIGYAITSLRRQTSWMVGAKEVNIVAALILVVLLTLTLTPVLDPARISVNSQVNRLLTGKIAADKFDFKYLRFDGGKYGNDELRKLLANTSHPQSALIRKKSESVLQEKYRSYNETTEKPKLDSRELAEKLGLYPKGKALDPSFVDFLVEKLQGQEYYINCNRNTESCPLLAIDLNADGQDEIVVLDGYKRIVFSLENGAWKEVGTLSGIHLEKLYSSSLEEILDKNDFEALATKWKDIRIGKYRYSINSNDQ